MKKVTITLALTALVLSAAMNSVPQIGEWLTRDDFYRVDELRSVVTNERHGRSGLLDDRGSLLPSPCTLMTNELTLLSKPVMQGATSRFRCRWRCKDALADN